MPSSHHGGPGGSTGHRSNTARPVSGKRGTVTVQNLQTGNFWNGAAWAASGNIGTNATNVYASQSADPVVEDLSVTLSPLVTIPAPDAYPV